MSPLAQGRGLKSPQPISSATGGYVAPRAGAWIEIRAKTYIEAYVEVAPRAGAWIEICPAVQDHVSAWSPLAQGRGLKFG